MANGCEVLCKDCGTTFVYCIGDGFHFHTLHCEKCGKGKSIAFKTLGELRHRYLESLPSIVEKEMDEFRRRCLKKSDSVAPKESHEHVRDDAPMGVISKEEYRKGVEEMAGSCVCGGRFTFDATPRCPQCQSANFEETFRGSWLID